MQSLFYALMAVESSLVNLCRAIFIIMQTEHFHCLASCLAFSRNWFWIKTWYRWIQSVSKNSKTTLLVYLFSPLHPAQIAKRTVKNGTEFKLFFPFNQHPITDFGITIVAVEMTVIKDRDVTAAHVLWCKEYEAACICSKCQGLFDLNMFIPAVVFQQFFLGGFSFSDSSHSFIYLYF